MKPVYDEIMGKWKVKGIGWFDSPADAWKAIKHQKLNVHLLININMELKEQLEKVSIERGTTISEIVRTAIRKEVNL